MGDKSKIEWTDATWNPTSGCTKVSDGCKFCYAERVFPRSYGNNIATKDDGVPPSTALDKTRKRVFSDVWMHWDRLDQPIRWKKPRRIFVDSMSDLFHENIPQAFIDKVFLVMLAAPQHTYQILTKRPYRMYRYITDGVEHSRIAGALDWLREKHPKLASASSLGILPDVDGAAEFSWVAPQIQLGISCENQDTFEDRFQWLVQTPATHRFLSLEPLLAPIKLGLTGTCPKAWYEFVDQVIVGGESGPRARPMHPDWVRSIRDECLDIGVPFFFKQWGQYAMASQQAIAFDKAMCTHGKVAEFKREALAKACSCKQWEGIAAVGKKKSGRVLDDTTWTEFP